MLSQPRSSSICSAAPRLCAISATLRLGSVATYVSLSRCSFAEQVFVRWLLRPTSGPARTGARRFCTLSHTMFARPLFLSSQCPWVAVQLRQACFNYYAFGTERLDLPQQATASPGGSFCPLQQKEPSSKQCLSSSPAHGLVKSS